MLLRALGRRSSTHWAATWPQPTVAHHLALLRDAGLVRLRRDGRQHVLRAGPRARRGPTAARC
ncbi:MAG: helix-turn-helix transcriptional regulator [Ardenticatenales bacterium]|nr:helix-turn-helix transcriptional regulator [Ardenticatenales bacterium]